MDAAAAAAFLAAEGIEDEAGDPLAAGGPPLEIWPQNWGLLELWLQLEERWLLDPLGRARALDMTQAESLIRLQELPEPRRVTRELLEMERAALDALRELEDATP